MRLALLAIVVVSTVALLWLRGGDPSHDGQLSPGASNEPSAVPGESGEPVDLVALPTAGDEEELLETPAPSVEERVEGAAREAVRPTGELDRIVAFNGQKGAWKLQLDAVKFEAGSYTIYSQDGGIISVTPRLQPPPLDGLYVEQYEDGSPKVQGHHRNGKRVGVWTEWYENGKKKSEGRYMYGIQHGLWTEWNPNGQRSSEGEFLYAKREGAWTEWHPNGKQSEAATYRNGNREGRAVTWYEDGTKRSDGTWMDGQKEQRWRTWWHADGSLSSEGAYEYGKRVGPWKYWHPDQTLDEAQSGYYEGDEKTSD